MEFYVVCSHVKSFIATELSIPSSANLFQMPSSLLAVDKQVARCFGDLYPNNGINFTSVAILITILGLRKINTPHRYVDRHSLVDVITDNCLGYCPFVPLDECHKIISMRFSSSWLSYTTPSTAIPADIGDYIEDTLRIGNDLDRKKELCFIIRIRIGA